MIVLYIDGGCQGNGQKNVALREMVFVVADEKGEILREGYKAGGSNNLAELEAFVEALRYCREAYIRTVTIYTDSRNNLAWVYGKKIGKQVNDRDAVVRLKGQIEELGRHGVRFLLKWVPREKNLAGHYLEQRLGV